MTHIEGRTTTEGERVSSPTKVKSTCGQEISGRGPRDPIYRSSDDDTGRRARERSLSDQVSRMNGERASEGDAETDRASHIEDRVITGQ